MNKLMFHSNPIPGFPVIDREMDRFLNDLFGKGVVRFSEGWMPNADVTETKDEVIVRAEVPGMNKEDISITLQDGVLTLRGEKKQEKTEKEAAFHRVERSYGSFVRSFTLPTLVQADKVRADYKDGVLTINLPKAEEVKPKEITISVN